MTDIWDHLSLTDKHIVMYGMGNGSDKIISRLEKHGKTVSDFFASDSFVRGQSFHGKTVLTFDVIKDKYKDFIILIAFGSQLDDVLTRFYYLDENYECYAPDVPVVGDDTFDRFFYESNVEKIRQARECFDDDFSKITFDRIIEYKLKGKISLFKDIDTDAGSEYKNILKTDYKTIVDCGAYTGDSAKEFLCAFPGVKQIYSLEPDAKNYKKLLDFSKENLNVIPINCCAWDKNETVFFDKSGNRNANAFSSAIKKVPIDAKTVDSICKGNADFIKYDVEGAEKKAIIGSEKTIYQCSPDLKVAVYHRNEDIFEIPLLIKRLNPAYRLYLRKNTYVPCWEVNVFACM